MVARTIDRLVTLQSATDIIFAVKNDPAALVLDALQERRRVFHGLARLEAKLDVGIGQGRAVERFAEQHIVRRHVRELLLGKKLPGEGAKRLVETLLAATGVGEEQAAVFKIEAELAERLVIDAKIAPAAHVHELEI